MFVVAFHPQDIKFRAFMLSPVPIGGYSIAMIAALIEFWVEDLILRKNTSVGAVLLCAGFVIGFSGWVLRVAALFTAQANFTHLVAHRKKASHELVVRGVYGWCRHPGYLGWFMWSVSTQLVLLNPICCLAYAAVAWKFFEGRIPGEEELLVHFFGQQYLDYAQRVPCGLPWISELGRKDGTEQ